MMGPGSVTCGQYAEEYRRDPTFADFGFFSWAQGFMSGFNLAMRTIQPSTTPPGGEQPDYPKYTPPTDAQLWRQAMNGPGGSAGIQQRFAALRAQRDKNVVELQKEGIAAQSRMNVAGTGYNKSTEGAVDFNAWSVDQQKNYFMTYCNDHPLAQVSEAAVALYNAVPKLKR
jgi:hypothetical protein